MIGVYKHNADHYHIGQTELAQCQTVAGATAGQNRHSTDNCVQPDGRTHTHTTPENWFLGHA